jgi:multiple sugar transport system ATP-binding protein
MAEVEYKNVHKIFDGSVHAVKDMNLRIHDGEFFVLVGPSGCGKSTALRLIAGLEKVSSGEVFIGRNIVNDLPPQSRNIAMVFQDYALYPHKTVRKNLEFPLKMVKMDWNEIDKRVTRASRLLGLEDVLDRKPKQLSGGQRQRVAMGRAIVRDPEVFLMDEPLSNLDAKLRVEIRAEIARLQKDIGITTIYVTHDQVEAMTLGDRVAVMKKGEIQQVAPAREIYDHPANVFVAGFIGSPRMNVFQSRLIKKGKKFAIECGDQTLPVNREYMESCKDLREYINISLLAGLRPEAFVPPEHVPENQRIQARVYASEALGHEMIIYFESPVELYTEEDESSAPEKKENLKKKAMVARLPAGPQPRAGEKITLGIQTGKLHFFSPEGDAIY